MSSIAVSGMGIISALGNGVSETLDALLKSRSGIGKIKYLKTEHDLPVAEVQYSDEELLELSNIKKDTVITRTTLFGILALREALENANISKFDDLKIAFISGTTVGGMEKSENFYQDFLETEQHLEYISVHDCGSCTNQIAEFVRPFHSITTISTACSSAANAAILGANMIKSGIVDIAIVGGSECLTRFHLNGFNTLKILDPELCRPFCETRNGINLGEGAAYLVLESEESSKKRNVKPLCKLSGYGNACDAFHQTASSPEGIGATIAMQKALQTANLLANEIDYINAHGTATPNNDESESQAIENVFADKIPFVSSTKAHTGHTTSAAGAVESVISILAMQHRFIPQTLHHKKDMNFKVKTITQLMENQPLKNVMTNSFGFGGNNSTLIFSKCM